MYIDRGALKRQAREDIHNARPHPALVTLVYLLLTFVLTALVTKITGQIDQLLTYLETGVYYSVVRVSVGGWLLSVAIQIISLFLGLGYVAYCLRISRGISSGVGTIFDGFGYFPKYLGLSIVMSVFVFLWSLLFVIPGIVAAYRYRMSVYLMLDHPEMGIMECIAESKRMMHGRKAELFVLDLSFLGWAILAIIPFVSLWVQPYISVTEARFYQALAMQEPNRRP